MARDDFGYRDREREERFGQGGERPGPDRQGSERGRDPYSGAMFGTERDSPGGRSSQQGDERELGYGGHGSFGGERSRYGQGAQPGRGQERYDREERGERFDRLDRDREMSQGFGGGRERFEGGAGQDRARETTSQPGMGGWMGREAGGRYGGRPEDDLRPMMRHDRQDHEGGYAREYGRESGFDRQGSGMSGRPGGASGVGGFSGAGYAGSQGGFADRNPGQGFGAFGYSNADESGTRIEGRQQRGGFAGRGPRNYQRSDERIRDDVCERLTRHHEIDASDVDIDVREGIVTLSGKVEDKHTKRLAEDIAEEVMGVRDVRNELRTARGGLLNQLFGRDDADEARAGSSHAEREVSRQASRDRGGSGAMGSGTTGDATSGTTGAGDPSVTRSRGASGATGNATAGDLNASRRGRTE